MESPPQTPQSDDTRLDKWLWMIRGYKTRALATEACRLGRVSVEGREAKAFATIRPGAKVEARQGLVRRRWCVLGIPTGRQGAAKVPEFAKDETPAEDWEAANAQRVQHLLSGGGGRPTKRQRRDRDALQSPDQP